MFFDPPDKYIWSLAVDRAGNVFAGTGDKGVIYKLAPDGRGAASIPGDRPTTTVVHPPSYTSWWPRAVALPVRTFPTFIFCRNHGYVVAGWLFAASPRREAGMALLRFLSSADAAPIYERRGLGPITGTELTSAFRTSLVIAATLAAGAGVVMAVGLRPRTKALATIRRVHCAVDGPPVEPDPRRCPPTLAA